MHFHLARVEKSPVIIGRRVFALFHLDRKIARLGQRTDHRFESILLLVIEKSIFRQAAVEDPPDIGRTIPVELLDQLPIEVIESGTFAGGGKPLLVRFRKFQRHQRQSILVRLRQIVTDSVRICDRRGMFIDPFEIGMPMSRHQSSRFWLTVLFSSASGNEVSQPS